MARLPLLSLFMFAGSVASAQVRPGGNGPLPGDPGYQPPQAPYAPEFRIGKAKVWGAAVRGLDGKIQVAYAYPSKSSARAAAMAACMAKPANQGQCILLASEGAVSFAVARGNGQDYFGMKVTNSQAARIALATCQKAANDCQLIAVIDTITGPTDPSSTLFFLDK